LRKETLKAALVAAIKKAVTVLPPDVVAALKRARGVEEEERARSHLDAMHLAAGQLAAMQLAAILQNIEIARARAIPLCQDTGIQTFFVRAGVESPFLKGLPELIAAAVAEATTVVPLRPNTVDPFTGANPGNNLGRFMPLIEWDLVAGDEITIDLLPKGGGSENCCVLKMLMPGDGIQGIERAVIDHVISCKGAPCPPTIVGGGIGGGSDTAMKLAKRAIMREIGSRHPDLGVAALEGKLLALINESGVGPMGLGGRTTSLAVHIEYTFRHPASLPLGIVIQCWAARRAKVHITADGRVEVV
jgi:fumarate hydratase subunit alpha